MESVEPLLKKLPKELQRIIQPHSVPSFPPPLASTSSNDVTFMEIGEGGIEGGDDLGAVIVRRKPIESKEKGEEKPRMIPIKRPPSPEVITSQDEEEEEEEVIVSPPPMKKLKKSNNSLEVVKTKGKGTGRKEDEGIGLLPPLESSLQPLKKGRAVSKKSDSVVVKKKKLVTREGDEMVVKKKKKKPRPSGEGDEIDAIFG